MLNEIEQNENSYENLDDTKNPFVQINMEALQNNYSNDPLILHLKSCIYECKKRRYAYWKHYLTMRRRNNYISIPLLIITSATGVTTIAQVGYNTKVILPIISTFFGVSSAVLSALHRYSGYAERSEHSKYMAKNYSRITKKIENTIIFIESKSTVVNPKKFKMYMDEIEKEIERITNEAEDIPIILLDKDEYDTFKENNQKLTDKREFQLAKYENMVDRIHDDCYIQNYIESLDRIHKQHIAYKNNGGRSKSTRGNISMSASGSAFALNRQKSYLGTSSSPTMSQQAKPFISSSPIGSPRTSWDGKMLLREVEKKTKSQKWQELEAQAVAQLEAHEQAVAQLEARVETETIGQAVRQAVEQIEKPKQKVTFDSNIIFSSNI